MHNIILNSRLTVHNVQLRRLKYFNGYMILKIDKACML